MEWIAQCQNGTHSSDSVNIAAFSAISLGAAFNFLFLGWRLQYHYPQNDAMIIIHETRFLIDVCYPWWTPIWFEIDLLKIGLACFAMSARSNTSLFLRRGVSECLLCDLFRSNMCFSRQIFLLTSLSISPDDPLVLLEPNRCCFRMEVYIKKYYSLSPSGLCYLKFVNFGFDLGKRPRCIGLDSGTYAELWLGFSARLHPLPA